MLAVAFLVSRTKKIKMNRDLKFRGKRIDKNEWVYGGISCTQNKDKYFINTFDSSGFLIMLEVEPKTIGQFTGVLDKANTEIYEGDFVSTDLQRPHNKIIFKNGAFMFECYDDNLYHDIFFSVSELQQTVYKYGQVIGNIIDNDELDYLPS